MKKGLMSPPEHELEMIRETLTGLYANEYHLATALALNRGLSGAIRILSTNDEINTSFIETADGHCYRANGRFSEDEIRKRFNKSNWPPEQIDEEGVLEFLCKNNYTPDLVNQHALRVGIMLEMIHPDWPWENRPSEKINKYLEALTELSQEHGIWLVDPSMGQRPLIGFTHGDEAGYQVTPTINGDCFHLNRVFKR